MCCKIPESAAVSLYNTRDVLDSCDLFKLHYINNMYTANDNIQFIRIWYLYGSTVFLMSV